MGKDRIDLDTAYQWLNRFSRSQLRDESSELVDLMFRAIAAGKYSHARQIMSRLQNLCPQIDQEVEDCEILIHCGRAEFLMGDILQAEDLLRSAAARLYTRPHNRAVALWMLGCVQCGAGDCYGDAMAAWQKSVAIFQNLAQNPCSGSEQKSWYQSRLPQLERTLHNSVITERTPDPPVENIGAAMLSIRAFPVSGSIPAGGFGPTGFDPNPSTWVNIELERIVIDGAEFRVVNLRSGKIVRLTEISEYFIMRVQGDSMNNTQIEDGDYVLLRPQPAAIHGDIVAAEIVGIDDLATLKKYIIRREKIFLQPCSTNPRHKEREVKSLGEDFYVRGVAIAALKPA